jgi:hypothetical protein
VRWQAKEKTIPRVERSYMTGQKLLTRLTDVVLQVTPEQPRLWTLESRIFEGKAI